MITESLTFFLAIVGSFFVTWLFYLPLDVD